MRKIILNLITFSPFTQLFWAQASRYSQKSKTEQT
jgi:hypothetical protein